MSWPLVSLDEISVYIRNGASIKQSKDANGLPITRIETIAEREVNLEKCGYADVGQNDLLDYRLAVGDILISHINSEKHLGKCAIYEGARKDIVHGMNLLCLRPKQEKLFPRYLFHLMSSPVFKRLIPPITKKSVNQASFTVTAFKRLEIPLPPLTEQKRIAAILDKADAIRRKRQQAIQLANDFLRAVFLDMFGDPATNTKGWEKKLLANVVNFTTGKLDSNAAVEGGKYPFFTCSRENFQIDTYAFDCEALLLAGNNAAAKYSVKHYKGKFNAYQRTYVITICHDRLSYNYLKIALELKLNDLQRLSKGTNTKYLTLGILNDISVKIPDKESLAKFDKFTKNFNTLLNINKITNNYMENAFNSLTYRAFRGQL